MKSEKSDADDHQMPFVCSLNLPTDLNIQPNEYAALLDVMAQREPSKTMFQVFENLTHFDTPSDLSSNEITQKTIAFIT